MTTKSTHDTASGSPVDRTKTKKQRMLDALAQGLSVEGAALKTGISRTSAYKWRQNDKAFATAWDEAIEQGTDRLEDIALARAEEGSERMIAMLLKIRRPGKWRDDQLPQSRQNAVVHLPDMPKDTKTWLERYGPKQAPIPTDSSPDDDNSNNS